ncbi:hypothetical protein FGL01_22790 [Flavobacterium glycines]|uniref:Uncharacterized protein n=2 Tax=Flavobacterium glycines TaxID=551990 RepID=A0A511CFW3_9FLAO|nr:hypothetical protein FGL01_22790 [Flavobacterium glycines]
MTQTTKNILQIILVTLLLSVLIFAFTERSNQLWKKTALILMGLAFIILEIRRIKRIKYFNLIENDLIINQTFSDQKRYDLKAISSWTENHYNLLGIKTGNEIIINIEGEKIRLFERNSKDYEKLSDYLNDKLSAKYENYR